jgi:subtilisin-like proprotein convertase family protein
MAQGLNEISRPGQISIALARLKIAGSNPAAVKSTPKVFLVCFRPSVILSRFMMSKFGWFFALALCGRLLVQPAVAGVFAGTGMGDIPDPLADGPTNYIGGALVVSFDVAGLATNVQSVWLSVTMNHEWVGDLDVFLTSPAGTNFTIFSRVGASSTNNFFGDNAQLSGTYEFFDYASNTLSIVANQFENLEYLDDPGSVLIESTNIIPGGYFRPSAAGPGGEPATTFATDSGFKGLSPAQANGTWTLTFRDGSGGDTGAVTSATLYINEATPTPPPLRFTRIAAANGTVQLNLTGPFGQNFTLLRSTNIALPFAAWETAGSGTFDSLGNASFSTDATLPQVFFQISVP